MLLQISVCVLLLDRVMGHVHFNALDGLRYDRATVKMGEAASRHLHVANRLLCSCCVAAPLETRSTFNIWNIALAL